MNKHSGEHYLDHSTGVSGQKLLHNLNFSSSLNKKITLVTFNYVYNKY